MDELGALRRTQLGLSQTWYSLMETLGINKIKAIVSGVSTLPDSDMPCFLLGKKHHTATDEQVRSLARDFASKVHVTYRADFPAMGTSGLTSDAGWGCTIRSGQMLLANALVRHRLGDDCDEQTEASEGAEDQATPEAHGEVFREVVSHFLDSPGRALSIHRLVQEGAPFGIKPGHWVGPFVLSRTIDKVLADWQEPRMSCYLVCDPGGTPTLYKDQVIKHQQAGEEWNPTLMLIPVTLGVTPSINPCYIPQILAILGMPQSVGIIGGRPGSSLYLLGCQGGRIIYLDPHSLKPSLAGQDPLGEEGALDSYFCDSLQHMAADRLDPSLAIGFYLRTRGSFDDLFAKLGELQARHAGCPLVCVREQREEQRHRQSLDGEPLSYEGNWEVIQ